MSKIDSDSDLAIAAIACATGKRRLLKDDEEEGGKRKPDLAWWLAVRDEIDGKVPDVSKTEIDLRNATRPIFETGDDGRDPEVPPPAEAT